jgi:hypothetical protein
MSALHSPGVRLLRHRQGGGVPHGAVPDEGPLYVREEAAEHEEDGAEGPFVLTITDEDRKRHEGALWPKRKRRVVRAVCRGSAEAEAREADRGGLQSGDLFE